MSRSGKLTTEHSIGGDSSHGPAASSEYQFSATRSQTKRQPQQQQQQHWQAQMPASSGSLQQENARAQEDEETLQWSGLLLSMASIGIAACFLTSAMLQIICALFGFILCGVNFQRDDPSADVTWLVASCWLAGFTRFLLSICIGRPPYNRSVWPVPSRHRGFSEQMAALAFLPDVLARSRDMSVLDRAQLAAGIIHPAFYHRTLLVAWQEGLLFTLWLILHLVRLMQLNDTFSGMKIQHTAKMDMLINDAFTAIGPNSTAEPLNVLSGVLRLGDLSNVVNKLKSLETVHRLSNHTCVFMASTAAELFYFEDCFLLGLLAFTLLLLPVLSRMLGFIYSH